MATETINARVGTKEILKELSRQHGLSQLDVLQLIITSFVEQKKCRIVDIKDRVTIVGGKMIIADDVDIAGGKPYKPWLDRKDANDIEEV